MSTAPDPADTAIEQAAKVIAKSAVASGNVFQFSADDAARALHDAGLLDDAGQMKALRNVNKVTSVAIHELVAENAELRATAARVATLRDQWAILAGQAMNADTREWLDAASKSLRAALDGAGDAS